MRANEYQLEANQFCSPSWNATLVDKNQIASVIEEIVDLSEELDLLKKSLFYGKPSTDQFGEVESPFELPATSDQDLIHAVIGIITEAGELGKLVVEAVDKLDESKVVLEFDRQNAKEEGGDLLWYVALLCRALGVPLEEMMGGNINKLSARYKAKQFTAQEALNRNTTAEMAALDSQ